MSVMSIQVDGTRHLSELCLYRRSRSQEYEVLIKLHITSIVVFEANVNEETGYIFGLLLSHHHHHQFSPPSIHHHTIPRRYIILPSSHHTTTITTTITTTTITTTT